jgi:hypothetical protein
MAPAWQVRIAPLVHESDNDAGIDYPCLEWSFDDDDTFDELNISCPYTGAKFFF